MAVISKVESPNDHGACILVHMGLASDLRCWRGCRTGVPADTDEITQEWLTAAFDQAGALDQARVTSIQPAPIGQLGFTGQIRRLQISYDKPEPCAPRSLVAKFSATHPEVRAAVHTMGFYEREIGFYRELAADCPGPHASVFFRRSRDG
jgi:hypothetical protein